MCETPATAYTPQPVTEAGVATTRPNSLFRAWTGPLTQELVQSPAKFGLGNVPAKIAPNDTTRVAPLITSIGAAVAEKGVRMGEFIGARGILKGQLRQAFRENGFLLNALMRAQERPEEVDELVALHGGLMDQISLEEVNKWAAKVLAATNCRSAAIVPKAFVGMFDAGR